MSNNPSMCMMFISVIITTFLSQLVLSALTYNGIPYPEHGPDIDGYSYCGRRSGQRCCAGRDDQCTVPILDTQCYCDIFCSRTVSDCCPDFWQLCMGVNPPPGAQTIPTPVHDVPQVPNNCYHEGVTYQLGSTIRVNCNNCSCVNLGPQKEYNWNCTQKICLIREKVIDAVNGGTFGWRASNYSFLWGKTLSEGINQRLGTLKPSNTVRNMTSMSMIMDGTIPATFDARQKWPGLVHKINDQGDCGASWAFSTIDVASDRLSIHSLGMYRDSLSVQHVVSCDFDEMQRGCRGGHLDRAWWFLRRVGVVTDTCYPYSSADTLKRGRCLVSRRYYQIPDNKVGCPVGNRQSRIYQSTPPYRIANNERDIMKEIMDNGPVQAIMEVKEDFFMYSGGVYRYSVPEDITHKHHRKPAYHSVKIIGWGTDRSGGIPKKYWLVANSWGTQWGENGYFRILRGENECDIEAFVVAAWAKVNGRQLIRRMHQRRRNNRPQGDQPRVTEDSYERLRNFYNNRFKNQKPENKKPENKVYSGSENSGSGVGVFIGSGVESGGGSVGSGVGIVSSGGGIINSGAGVDVVSGTGVVESGAGVTESGAGVVESGGGVSGTGVVGSAGGVINSGTGIGAGVAGSGAGVVESGSGVTESGAGVVSGGGVTSTGTGICGIGVGVSGCGPGVVRSKPYVPESGAGVVESGAGVSESGAGVVESGAGVTESGAGVVESGAGVVESGAGVTESGAGVVESGAGVVESGAGVVESGAGVVESGAGVTESGAGVVESGAGVVESGAGVVESGAGVTESGAGVVESGAGVVESGAGVTESGAGVVESGAGVVGSGAGVVTSGGGSETGIGGSGSGFSENIDVTNDNDSSEISEEINDVNLDTNKDLIYNKIDNTEVKKS